MPRYNIKTQRFSDRILNKASAITLEYDTKYIVDRILSCLKPLTRRNAAEYVGLMLLQTVSPYVPYKTGNLLKNGLYTSIKTSPGHAAVDLRVRNTSKVKYAFYQYYGNVWAPNYVQWGQGPSRNGTAAVQSGWVSPKGKGSKHQTSRVLGDARTITLSDGRVIHIDGYTNPKSKPMWLEYVRRTPEIWVPYTKRVQRELKEMFDSAWYDKPTIAKLKLLRSEVYKGAEKFNPKS